MTFVCEHKASSRPLTTFLNSRSFGDEPVTPSLTATLLLPQRVRYEYVPPDRRHVLPALDLVGDRPGDHLHRSETALPQQRTGPRIEGLEVAVAPAARSAFHRTRTRIASGAASLTGMSVPGSSRTSLPRVAITAPVPAAPPRAAPFAAPLLPPTTAPMTAPAPAPMPILVASSPFVASASCTMGSVRSGLRSPS